LGGWLSFVHRAREAFQQLLAAVRSDADLDPRVASDFLGYAPNAAQLAALRNQLRRLPEGPVDAVADVVLNHLEEAARDADPLAAEVSAVEKLFVAARAGSELELSVRYAFGALTPAHSQVLRSAITEGYLTPEMALSVIHDGEALTKLLGDRTHARVDLAFRTCGFGQAPPRGGGMLGTAQQVVRVDAHDVAFDLLVGDEFHLLRAAEPDPHVVHWLRRTFDADSTLYDVGANRGYYSLYAVTNWPGARAVCFEPDPSSFAALCANVAINRAWPWVAPFAVAATDGTGIASFSSGGGHHGAHYGLDVGDEWLGGQTAGCVCYTLDDFVRAATWLQPPTHLKVDVDGLELGVLRGAEKTLANAALRDVLVELRDAREVELATALLGKVGFTLTRGTAEGFGTRAFRRGVSGACE
jgi:FkbM family methyltransferase